ncbi:HAD family hydrolase [Georgenia ruanii]|uniref:HAD-IA family hydrolase n=1 Tax=Georgenia ruanii TaxID=348442 RepID=A0A7J9USA1_9MICO|nr:HAD-IA family hydrolase [Georgenia ruanii]MPV87223.1 HAD-IA family hydrolase [Georgenia ruanii]
MSGAPGAAVAAALAAPGAALLLDLDGTLVDSEPTHRAAYRRYFARRGWRVDEGTVRAFAPVAVVTSAHRAWACAVLDRLGVAELGVALATAEVTAAGKPDPAPYRYGAALVGAEPPACVAAEDTPAGLAAALGAGVGLVLGVTTSHPAAELRAAGAHHAVPDLTALVPQRAPA